MRSIGQIVSIPDPNFKNACVNFGIVDFDGDGVPESDVDTNDDGEIQVSEALAVERMYPRGAGIFSLEGIEEFTNLQILNCSMNGLSELDFSQNTQLTILSCFFNTLTSLNVSQNSNLVELNCDLNNLTVLDLSGNPLLERLTCPSNELTELDLTQNPALVTFTGDLNQFTSLDFTQNPALEFVSFDNNQISTIDFSQNPNLSVVDIFNNNITSLNLSQNPMLTKLWCYNNDLQALDIKNGNNTAITIMRAQDNSTLDCIQVDDVVFAENQASWEIDPTASYSETCAFSIDEFSFEDIILYPNPVKNELNFSISEVDKISEIEIISTTGGKMQHLEFFDGIIDVSHFPTGVYYIHILGANETVVRKIMKL